MSAGGLLSVARGRVRHAGGAEEQGPLGELVRSQLWSEGGSGEEGQSREGAEVKRAQVIVSV